MGNWDYKENKESNEVFSFNIRKNPHSTNQFLFTGIDKMFGFEGKASLSIETPPSLLHHALDDSEKKILICKNICSNKENFYSDLFEKYFIKLISKALAELFRFCLSHQLSGVLFILPSPETNFLTDLQKHWLSDFNDLFQQVESSPENLRQLYMPTHLKAFQHYSMLHALLEQTILTTKYNLA